MTFFSQATTNILWKLQCLDSFVSKHLTELVAITGSCFQQLGDPQELTDQRTGESATCYQEMWLSQGERAEKPAPEWGKVKTAPLKEIHAPHLRRTKVPILRGKAIRSISSLRKKSKREPKRSGISKTR